MIEPMLFDVVETIYPLVESGVASGAKGTIVYSHGDGSYEVEFTDDNPAKRLYNLPSIDPA